MREQFHHTSEILQWLLEGDVSIQYQTHRDLLDENRSDLRKRIETEGWGAQLLAKRNKNGHWGRGFYQPKWTSTHYTLLDLRNFEIPRSQIFQDTILDILHHNRESDGGVNQGKTIKNSDVCINDMFLNYATFFGVPQDSVCSIIDFLIGVQMGDGGFNCKSNRGGCS